MFSDGKLPLPSSWTRGPQSQPQGMWSLAPWVHSWTAAQISISHLQLPCSEGLPHTFPLGGPYFSTSRPSAVRFFSIIERGLGDRRELLGERQTLDLYYTPRVVQTLSFVKEQKTRKCQRGKDQIRRGGEWFVSIYSDRAGANKRFPSKARLPSSSDY